MCSAVLGRRTSYIKAVDGERIMWNRKKRETPSLAAEFQTLEQLLVLLKVMPFDIIEKLAPTAGHSDQATAAVKILTVCPQVICQVGDALRKQCDLDFRRTGVGIVTLEVGNY